MLLKYAILQVYTGSVRAGFCNYTEVKELYRNIMGAPKGNIPWNKGKKMSEEYRATMRISNKGKNLGNKFGIGREPWNKGKVGVMPEPWNKGMKGFNAGEKNPSWKGGISESSRKGRIKFLREMQSKVFIRDNYTCQICDQYSGYLQVDHIKKWSDYPELRYDLDNCRTLCMACHYYVTFKRKMPKGIIWGHNLSRGIE